MKEIIFTRSGFIEINGEFIIGEIQCLKNSISTEIYNFIIEGKVSDSLKKFIQENASVKQNYKVYYRNEPVIEMQGSIIELADFAFDYIKIICDKIEYINDEK